MNRYWYGLITIGLLMTTGCSTTTVGAASKDAVPVRAYRVESTAFSTEQRYAATAEPITQLDLAFRTGGVVTSVYRTGGRALEPGDSVPEGAVLAQLRATEYEARVHAADAQVADATASKAAAQAQVHEAQAAATQAEGDLRRAEALTASQAMTRAELDAVRARHDAAQARVQAARTNVQALDARIQAAAAQRDESKVPLADTVMAAPFPAVVVARRLDPGSSVAPGTPAYTLADLRQVKLSFGVADTVLRQFPVGSVVRATADALPGERFTGRVLAVSPVADPVNRLYRVQALVNNPGGRIKAGMVATVVVDEPQSKAMPAVPLRAIRRLSDHGDRFAVLAIRDNRVEVRAVTLGPTQGDWIAVKSGLAAGESIVEDAGTRLTAGDVVRIVP